jgi:hypothetical protein
MKTRNSGSRWGARASIPPIRLVSSSVLLVQTPGIPLLSVLVSWPDLSLFLFLGLDLHVYLSILWIYGWMNVIWDTQIGILICFLAWSSSSVRPCSSVRARLRDLRHSGRGSDIPSDVVQRYVICSVPCLAAASSPSPPLPSTLIDGVGAWLRGSFSWRAQLVLLWGIWERPA